MAESKNPNQIVLSLISHTNVGKTALARTLLRKDVGEVRDSAHVTVVSEGYSLIEADGREALLWDTPGFGSNLAKLAKRLKSSTNPVGWILHQVWDRMKDTSLWCSQEAIRNISNDADVVIYLVDASQSPDTVGYVDLEMEILEWIGKPVLVFLNQTGRPNPERTASEESAWREHLAKQPIVKGVATLDAFTRCWIQEHEVLERTATVVEDKAKKKTAAKLADVWKNRNVKVFDEAVSQISTLMAQSVCDSEKLTDKSMLEKVKGLIKTLTDRDPELENVQKTMYARLAARTSTTINSLIELHGLDGKTARKIAEHSQEEFAVRRDVEESIASALGGAASGLVVGISADLVHGGMTFGSGAALGAVLGGATTYALAKGYNLAQSDKNSVRWTENHFIQQLEFVLMLYLGVAHFGRGRGVWQDPKNNPAHWDVCVHDLIEKNREAFVEIWKKAAPGKDDADKIQRRLEKVVRPLTVELLSELYPAQKSVFE
ncbi:MAG: DUF3482 domain-containing protein [Verrucomicrobiales bacterium]